MLHLSHKLINIIISNILNDSPVAGILHFLMIAQYVYTLQGSLHALTAVLIAKQINGTCIHTCWLYYMSPIHFTLDFGKCH